MAPRRLFLSGGEGSGSLVPKPKRSRPWNLWYGDVNGCRFMESQLESMVRAVVQDEVQKLFLNYMHPSPRPSISQIQEAVRSQLYFQTGLPHTLFTGKGIKSKDKKRITIAIKDANNRVVTYGPMSTLKIKIVVINGDFNRDGKASWSKEEFINHILPERCGKRPLLTGEIEVRMQAGVARIVDASFTDISKWTRSGKFRLGAIVSDGRYSGERVQEAISEAFKVKDGRLESSQKDCPPSLDDEVCRLKKIQKGGAFHEKLKAKRIATVQDFLRAKVMDANELRTLLGKGMSNKWWEATLEHASQCDLGNRWYCYHVAGEGIDLVFNSIFELTGARTNGQYQDVGDLSPSLQGKVNRYKKTAYMNRGDILELHDSRLERALHVMDAPLVPGSNSYNLYGSHHNAMFHATSSSDQLELEHQLYASCRELASEMPRPGSHLLPRRASFKKAGSFRSSSGKYQHRFVPGPSTSHHDETTKLSCGIFSDDQGFICYRGSQSYTRTDSLDEGIMALVQSPPPSSSRKWVQLSAAFKLVFVTQSAGRRARIARSRHQAMAARA